MAARIQRATLELQRQLRADAAARAAISCKDPEQRAFLVSIQDNSEYVRVLQHLGKETGCTQADLVNHLQPLCLACWSWFKDTGGGGGAKGVGDSAGTCAGNGIVTSLRAEIERLSKQVTACNSQAQMEINRLKGVHHCDHDLGDDTVSLYEGLQFCDQSTKDMVLHLVAAKLKQLCDGHAPNNLVQAVLDAVSGETKQVSAPLSGADAAALAKAQAEKAAAEEALADAEAAEAEAKARAEAAARRAEAAEEGRSFEAARAAEAERLAGDLKFRAVAAEQAAERMTKECDALQKELSKAKEDHAQLQEAATRLNEDLQAERRECERLRQEAERSADMATQNAARLEADLAEVRAKLRETEAALEEEIRNRPPPPPLRVEAGIQTERATKNRSSQTELQGEAIEAAMEENGRLKVLLEELRAKIRELVEACKQKGVSAAVMDTMLEGLGLAPVLKAKSAYQRLYDDAIERVQRLEQLRERYRQEATRCHRQMPGFPMSPAPADWQPSQPGPGRSGGVLAEIQSSPILHQLSPAPPTATMHHSSPTATTAAAVGGPFTQASPQRVPTISRVAKQTVKLTPAGWTTNTSSAKPLGPFREDGDGLSSRRQDAFHNEGVGVMKSMPTLRATVSGHLAGAAAASGQDSLPSETFYRTLSPSGHLSGDKNLPRRRLLCAGPGTAAGVTPRAFLQT